MKVVEETAKRERDEALPNLRESLRAIDAPADGGAGVSDHGATPRDEVLWRGGRGFEAD